MRRRLWLSFIFLLALFVLAGGIVFPSFGKKWLKKEFPLHLGLDLQGGTHLVYELDLSKIDKKDWGNAEESTLAVIRNRIDKFGVAEPVIQPLSVGGKKAYWANRPARILGANR